MPNTPTPTPQPAAVPFVNTGHPLRDWIAWRIANTPPSKPVFPMLNQLLQSLIPLLGNMMLKGLGSINPTPDD